jgi:hypothetical protein
MTTCQGGSRKNQLVKLTLLGLTKDEEIIKL